MITLDINITTKVSELNKFMLVLNNLIISLLSLNKKKNKKKVKFSSPEFYILSKPFKSNNNKKIKSILK